MERRRVLFAAATALAALGGGVWAVWGNPLDPFDDRRFTPAAWHAAKPERRARMCRDLIRQHLPAGTAEAQVVAILGAASRDVPSGEALVRAKAENRVLVYPLGSWPTQEMDDGFLRVHLDQHDRVLRAEIYGF